MTLFNKARTRILVGGAILMLLALSSCGGDSASAKPSSTNPQTTPSTEPIVEVDAMKAFREVLLRNSNYRDAESGEMLSIDQWFELGETVECEAQNYTVFDLDDDGTSEIILNMDVHKVKDYGTLILRYEEGTVVGYNLWARGFGDLKSDGTFVYSGGAFNHGVGKIDFSAFDPEIRHSIMEKVCYCESGGYEGENLKVSYYNDGAEITPDDFDLALKAQDEKEDVTWFDYTDDNVKALAEVDTV